jgi:hypothetical protein
MIRRLCCSNPSAWLLVIEQQPEEEGRSGEEEGRGGTCIDGGGSHRSNVQFQDPRRCLG